ncbi:alpha/beta hydrolase [Tsuneonella sp. HG222]
MMKRAILASALLMAGCAGSEHGPAAGNGSGAAKEDLRGADAHLSASRPDTVLRYGEHPRAFAELRMPAGSGPFPLAVIFHGGCWKTGLATQAIMGPLATRWQQLGIATLNVDYREVDDGGGWPGSFQDWQAAAQLIDRVAREHPIDRSRVTLAGHSAGGLPPLWLAMAQDASGPVGARAPVAVRAAIVLDGPGDVRGDRAAFDGLCRFAAVDTFMGGSPDEVPQRYDAISPLGHEVALEEALVVQAVLPPPGDAIKQAVGAGTTRLAVRTNPGASHFSVVTPGDPIYSAMEPAILTVLRGK